MKTRKIAGLITPHLRQGFLGEGHQAAALIDGSSFTLTDPFILLMDDQLNLPGGPPVGGPHPHAGFETVTLVLKGNGREWQTGSMEIMTAGKGIIHTEEITAKTEMRILQLWLVLPPEKRWAEPFLQRILAEDVPVFQAPGIEVKVYSGSSNGITSPIHNQTPVIIADFSIEAGRKISQVLPSSYNGFIFVTEGEVYAAERKIREGQVGWFDKLEGNSESEVVFSGGESGGRFILYAGEPQRAPIVSHGPFIGDSAEDIPRLYREFRQGLMPHLETLPADRKLVHQKAAIVK